MDPNENRCEQIALATNIRSFLDGLTPYPGFSAIDAASRLADLVLALDQWIMKNGALPKDWQR